MNKNELIERLIKNETNYNKVSSCEDKQYYTNVGYALVRLTLNMSKSDKDEVISKICDSPFYAHILSYAFEPIKTRYNARQDIQEKLSKVNKMLCEIKNLINKL